MQIQVLNTFGFLRRIRNSDKFVIGWTNAPRLQRTKCLIASEILLNPEQSSILLKLIITSARTIRPP